VAHSVPSTRVNSPDGSNVISPPKPLRPLRFNQRAIAAAGFASSILLLWWALRDVESDQLWASLQDADPRLLLAAVIASSGTMIIRTIRWGVLLEPTGPPLPFGERFAAICIGFATNNLLPVRMGDVVRAYTISRRNELATSSSIGSILVERLLDGLVVVGFGTVPLLLSGTMGVPFPEGWIKAGMLISGVVGAVTILVWWTVTKAERLVPPGPGMVEPTRTGQVMARVLGLVISGLAGMRALRSARSMSRALSWSIVLWISNSAAIGLALMAFGITSPGIPGVILLHATFGLAVALPSAPGALGPIEAAARIVLALYATEPVRIAGFVLLFHILSLLPGTMLGLWYGHRFGVGLCLPIRPGTAVT